MNATGLTTLSEKRNASLSNNLFPRPRIEANIKETQILSTISQMQVLIAEWFDIAPQDMYEGFDKRLRKRIGELFD